jgi:hypothetical protein
MGSAFNLLQGQGGQVGPNIGYAGGGGKAAGIIDAVLSGIRRGRMARFEQGYSQAEDQYRIAAANHAALSKAAAENSTDQSIARALEQATASLQQAYDNLINYGTGGSKGKGRATSKEGEPGGGRMAKIGQMLRNIMTGGNLAEGRQRFPIGPPTEPTGAAPSGIQPIPGTQPFPGTQPPPAVPSPPPAGPPSAGSQPLSIGPLAPNALSGSASAQQGRSPGDRVIYQGRTYIVKAVNPDGNLVLTPASDEGGGQLAP